ncbi:DUF429 domain-containing protein [Xenophilus arseniciresistens]|uniref:DUF429 domain-containing protein n=1 Tax=Xenophilus arseniciresistens TaxID=1283306 RepID=A0AAE3N7S3_9BURK|nr:DUF429 domain-containing protein [Xenophilus arseniciresistens]MDA7416686.1 DUF429 domain-containing protein [Xenophilus arseniciresistens]
MSGQGAATAPVLLLLGCDFSSAPTRRKPVTLAVGERVGDAVRLHQLLSFATLDAWQQWLAAQPAWLGGFDFPFGLPRALWQAWQWPADWEAGMRRYAALERRVLRERFKAFCDARPVGAKFAHRATDGPAGASPSMKWVNPPVAWMMHAGVPRLLDVGASFPGLGGLRGSARVALEAYPGLLARELIGRRSYKADDPARQNEARQLAREDLLARLQATGSLRLKLHLELQPAQHALLLADASGDSLDAVLCLMQAAWAQAQPRPAGASGYGLPAHMDVLEGWIVSA